MSEIEGKNILITGGASGIGLFMAEKMIGEKAGNIVIWDIDKEGLDAAVIKLSNTTTGIFGDPVDIRVKEEVIKACGRLQSGLKPIDILINNAGMVTGKLFEEHKHEEIDNTFSVNITGALHTTLELMQSGVLSDRGHIVNISSASAYIGNPRMSLYAASKWAMQGWSESLRLELQQQRSGRKVTVICPSYIDTGMFAGVTPPLLTPLLRPENIVNKIIKAIKNDRKKVLAPFMVKLLPFLKGVLPGALFDLIAGRIFGVYYSMKTFTGRSDK